MFPIKKLFPNWLKHAVKVKLGLTLEPQYARYSVSNGIPLNAPAALQTGTSFCDKSMFCKASFYKHPFFHYWYAQFKDDWVRFVRESPDFGFAEIEANRILYHRKIWEFIYILQTLYEHNCIGKGKRGLGFAVGKEPLSALFAKFGCRILATDINPDEDAAADWTATDQHSGGSLAMLNASGLCPPDVFEQNVQYRSVNMNEIPDDLSGFDFCWSSCSFEHLGSIEKGLAFVRSAMKTLKPDGIAVHTSEFNCTSDDATIIEPNLVLFRKQDILRLIQELEKDGSEVFPFDFSLGAEKPDKFVDIPPFFRKRTMLKLRLGDFTSTSFGIIVRKGRS